MEEEKELTLSDVEKNKELFEYEMTEVILQLKGEFAKISGKDMNCDVTDVSVEKPDIKMEVPDIAVKPVSIDTAGIIGADKFAALGSIPAPAIEKGSINTPEIPDISAAVSERTAVTVAPFEIDGLNVKTPLVTGIEAAGFKPESEAIDVPDIRIEVNKETAVSVEKTDVSVPGSISVPNMDSFDIKVDRISIDVPDTTVPGKKDIPEAAVERVSVNVPDINVPGADKIPAASVDKFDVHIGDISAPAQVKMTDVKLDQMNIDYPQVGGINANAEIKPVTVSKTHIDTEIPEIKEAPATEITVERTDIGDINSLAVPSVDIPEVKLQNSGTDVWAIDSSLPEGYQSQLDDILNSVKGSM